MTAEGMGPCLAVEGATTRIAFEVYLEKVLLPSLRRGQVVVMDNISTHKGERVKEFVRSAGGCETLSAAVLAGLQPHRRGLLEGQRSSSQGRGQEPRSAGEGYGQRARGGHCPRRKRFL
jgi:hypothetical protein